MQMKLYVKKRLKNDSIKLYRSEKRRDIYIMSFFNKKASRMRRALKIRKKIYMLEVCRLVAHRSLRHMYAQIISKDNNNVLVSASTTEKLISNQLKVTGNKQAAFIIGKIIAERAIKRNIINVSFDRSGFKYHGRIRALAEGARKFGLKF